MDDRPLVQLDYQIPEKREPWSWSRANAGFLVGLGFCPLFLILAGAMALGFQSYLVLLLLYPHATLLLYFGDHISYAIAGCILQPAVYGWLIGLILSSRRRWLGAILLIAEHAAIVAGMWALIK